jgi:peptidoglycan/LPS O-acetylase OafA/YrhL
VLSLFAIKPFNSAWLGVEIFFVVSGYVIVNALARDRYEPLSFFVKRVFRLTPALLCFLALSAGVFALFVHSRKTEHMVPDLAHRVPKEKAAAFAAKANGWDENKAWEWGTKNGLWDDAEAMWTKETEAAGKTPAEATEAARAARVVAVAKWRGQGWDEFGKQALSVVSGYFTLRGVFDTNPPAIYNNGAMWSLSVEDQFYAVLGGLCLVVALVLRRRAPRVMPAVIGTLAGLLYLYAVVVRLDFAFGGDYWGWHTHPPYFLQLQAAAYSKVDDQARLLARLAFYPVMMRFDFLALGILTAYFDRRFGQQLRAKLADRGPFLAWPLLLTPLVLGAATGDAQSQYHDGWLFLLAGGCFAPLVVLAAHDRMMPAARGVASRVLRYFGDRSYTIYLLHFPLMALAWYLMFAVPQYYDDWAVVEHPGQKRMYVDWATWVLKPGAGRYGLVQLVVVLALLLPLTEMVYRWVELPCMRLGKWLGKKVRIIPTEKPAVATAAATPTPPAVAA